jgi:hypothetical protein
MKVRFRYQIAICVISYPTYQTYLPYQAFVLDAHIAATHAGEVQARW